MSYFVNITFDLNDAPPAVYPRIQKRLSRLDFSKFITGRRRTNVRLPSNTFVARFETDDFARSADLVTWLRDKLKRIFERFGVSGKYFILVGREWAWSIGLVD